MKHQNANEPYIFVSYSHKNEKEVLPIIQTLQSKGFRVWYDDRVETGAEWPAYIEEKLSGCETFLALLSEDAVSSLNCRNEISLAVQMKKRILVIYLSKTELRHGLALQLGTSQALSMQKYPTVEAFYEKLFATKSILLCHDSANYPMPGEEDGDTPEPTLQKGTNGSLRPTMPDESIIDLYWQRDERAIDETDYKYRKFLYSIAYNIIHDNLDCEECLNDTYLGTWNRIPPQRPSKFRAFLARIMRNIAVDKYRYKSADKRIPSELTVSLEELEDCVCPSSSAEEDYLIRELATILNSFLKGLPDRQELIFVCRYYFADRVNEIAKLLKTSPATVNRELAKIRTDLKNLLIKEGFYHETE